MQPSAMPDKSVAVRENQPTEGVNRLQFRWLRGLENRPCCRLGQPQTPRINFHQKVLHGGGRGGLIDFLQASQINHQRCLLMQESRTDPVHGFRGTADGQ